VTFEYGRQPGDVFAIERFPQAANASRSAFLHPVLRHYASGVLGDEVHLLEDLFGVYSGKHTTDVSLERGERPVATWHDDEHEKPLMEFVRSTLSSTTLAHRAPSAHRATTLGVEPALQGD
jgi:hypothetical protein